MDRESDRSIEELLRLGEMGLDLGYWQQAQGYFDAVLDRVPSHVAALLGKAQACQDAALSLDIVRVVLTRQPENAEARRLEKRYLVQVNQAPVHTPVASPPPFVTAHPVAHASRPWYRHSWVAVLAVTLCLALVLVVTLSAIGTQPDAPSALPPTIQVSLPTQAPRVQPLNANSTAASDAAEGAQRATVLIVVPEDSTHELSRGSGCVVGEDGLILTNYHVVSDADQTRLANHDGLAYVGVTRDVRYPPDDWYIAVVVATDPLRDLAALRILSTAYGEPAATRFETLALGDSGALALGQGLIGLGYPTLGGDTLTLTRGSMAGFSTSKDGVTLGKTDSELLPGSSGGAVLDTESRLVGIITAAYADERTLGRLSYFLLVNEAHGVISQGTRAALPPPTDAAWMVTLFRETVQH